MRISRRMALYARALKDAIGYYGEAATLNVARSGLLGASNSSYAFFAGGMDGNGAGITEVDAYDANLTHVTVGASDLTLGVPYIHCGNATYVLFGDNSNVTAYDASATKSTPSKLSTARYGAGSACIGEYMIVGGGYVYSGSSSVNQAIVDVYDKSLTLSNAANLYIARRGPNSASSSTHAVFAGGNFGTKYADYYDASLTHSYDTNVPSDTEDCNGSATMNGRAVMWNCSGVIACDASRTWSSSGIAYSLNRLREDAAGAGVDDMMLIAGGAGTASSSGLAYVDMFDGNLVHSTMANLPAARRLLAGASIGKYVLFAGGEYANSDKVYNNVYAFKSNKKETA